MAYNRAELKPLVGKPLPWGFTSVAENVTPDNDYWVGGAAWSQNPSAVPKFWNPFDPEREDKSFDSIESIGTVSPMVIYMPYVCNTSGPLSDEDVKLAKDRLEAATSAAIERMFWTWAMSTAMAVGVTGDSGYAVAALGRALSESGLVTQGTIHMPSMAAELYHGIDPMENRGPLTRRGDQIIIGAGYRHEGTGSAIYIIGTGPVGYLASDIEINESPEYTSRYNERVVLAERYIGFQADDESVLKVMLRAHNGVFYVGETEPESPNIGDIWIPTGD